jgi:hypothetical protein
MSITHPGTAGKSGATRARDKVNLLVMALGNKREQAFDVTLRNQGKHDQPGGRAKHGSPEITWCQH